MSFLQLRNVSKNFYIGERSIPALKAIDLQINHGDLIAITGASGSGKSTLMNVLGLLDHYDHGEYWLHQQNVKTLTKRALAAWRNLHIGFIFQAFHLLPRMTVLQNVVLPLAYRKIQRQESFAQALQLLEHLHIQHLAQRYPQQLSGGQQQRVAIARALIGQPSLILADEPTGALDSKTSLEIMQLLLTLHQSKQHTIVIVTHDDKISHLCERRFVMQDGRMNEFAGSMQIQTK